MHIFCHNRHFLQDFCRLFTEHLHSNKLEKNCQREISHKAPIWGKIDSNLHNLLYSDKYYESSLKRVWGEVVSSVSSTHDGGEQWAVEGRQQQAPSGRTCHDRQKGTQRWSQTLEASSGLINAEKDLVSCWERDWETSENSAAHLHHS